MSSGSILNMKIYLIVQLLINFFIVLIVTVILVFVVFFIIGDGSGSTFDTLIFCSIYIFSFTFIQSHDAIVTTRKDYLRNKWKVKNKKKSKNNSNWNPFYKIIPISLLTGIPAVIIIFIIIKLLAYDKFNFITILIISFVPLILSSTISILLFLPGDQQVFSNAIDSKYKDKPKLFFKIILFEYILPWFPIQILLHLGIGYKQFNFEILSEAALKAGGIPLNIMIFDVGEVFALIFFFLCISSGVQVRSDVRLGRVEEKIFKISILNKTGFFISAILLIIVSILSGIIISTIFSGIMFIFNVKTFSVIGALLTKFIFVVLGYSSGCIVGSWYGIRKESNLILQEG